jgi:predicted DNA-binding transcriptional regulator AlpA
MKEAASYLSVAEQTLSALVKNGKAPPSILISYKARRFRCSELNKWVENGGANV